MEGRQWASPCEVLRGLKAKSEVKKDGGHPIPNQLPSQGTQPKVTAFACYLHKSAYHCIPTVSCRQLLHLGSSAFQEGAQAEM